MYVDDLITGFDNEVEGIEVCNEIVNILQSAKFELRKWASNSKVILNSLQNTSDCLSILNLGENDKIKTLGIQWLSQSDLLSYQVKECEPIMTITKRKILGSIAKIYDPLGLLSPCIILIKILMQKLWSLQLEWDESVPEELSDKWRTFQSQLSSLNELKIPRYVMCQRATRVELHGFSDASISAYSAVVYVRTTDCMNNVSVRLLCSKTKVAPVKALTVPRLELCGVLTLARLMKVVSDALELESRCYYWCDSQIVLSWLKTDVNKLQVFVSNRVREIQSLCDIRNFSYVNTKENPADVASRGIYPNELCHNGKWWNGPTFLYQGANWPHQFSMLEEKSTPELKRCSVLLVSSLETNLIFDRFSSLNKLVRVFAYVLRFIERLKKSVVKGALSVVELQNSLNKLVKLAQMESFREEIQILSKEKQLRQKHRLLSLSPFLDENQLMRVGGRLRNAAISFDNKHPILLDGKHKLTRLIFAEEHLRLHHAGPQLLLFSVREKYWSTSGMNVAKLTVKACLKCFRSNPKPGCAIMGDLPKHRVNISRPFLITGVDYAGPVNLRDRKTRPYKSIKAYICLFICLVSKCVHIELVSELSSNAFISVLRRFAARRGTPGHLYSDNGTHFIGAQKELKALYEFLKQSNDEIVAACAKQQIQWHFIPPRSPNFGGLWESNIKCIKYHLCRVIGDTSLTYEEYCTLLTQIEAILNSRPLYQLSPDPNDVLPFTPSHLLIGQALTTPPDPMFEESVTVNRLARFQLLQQLTQGFWKRWSKFYLTELQNRAKWKNTVTKLQVGQLVVLKNENLPPCKWALGRIVEVYPGDDGAVRVALVKTQHGTYKRSISKICPLPLPKEDMEVF